MKFSGGLAFKSSCCGCKPFKAFWDFNMCNIRHTAKQYVQKPSVKSYVQKHRTTEIFKLEGISEHDLVCTMLNGHS